MNINSELFNENAVFVSDRSDKNEIFRDVSQKLFDLDYVKSGFVDNLIERQVSYPTGILTRPLSRKMYNIATPYAEPKYVKQNLIVPIGLTNTVQFKNVVNQKESLDIRFIFLILNNNETVHGELLGKIMDFLAKRDAEELNAMFTSGNSKEIYSYLKTNF